MCHDMAACTNTIGGYNCTCFDGFEGDGFNCTDIDECLEEIDECDDNASCLNTYGDYNCTCNDGYDGDGYNCTNIDECELGIDECSEFADCIDTEGGYNCTCWLGYDGDGFNCTEVDECVNKITQLRSMAPPELIGEYSYCDDNAFCTNTDGGYNCTCNDGFEGDGFNCTDVDECLLEMDECSEVAFCNNWDGWYNCTCFDGYEGDGYNCTDIDECFEEIDECSENAFCTNTVPGYNCTCDEGYSGDGFNCTDVDECTEGLDDCDFEATCINLEGSFTCECQDGYNDNACQAGWSQQFDMCHKVFAGPTDFATAKADCESQGGWVAYFTSQQHDEWMVSLANGAVAWLGYEQVQENTKWRWYNHLGERFPTGYLNWQKGQPDKPGVEACMHYTGIGKWKNSACSLEKPYICQMPTENPGRNCTDIDECNEPGGELLCDVNGNCINSPGGYSCECQDGFQGFQLCFFVKIELLFKFKFKLVFLTFQDHC